MLPYIHIDVIHIGPIAINVWGFFVSLGIACAIYFGYRLSIKYLFSGQVFLDMAVWALVGAFIFSRLFHVVFYDTLYFLSHPVDIIKFWQGGASSVGGFFGAIVGMWLFAKKRRFSFKELLPYFDFAAVSLWLGWGIGRIGCFLTHQHTGILTNFFLSVPSPEGPRFELGLLESIVGFLFFGIYMVAFRYLVKIRWGWVFILSVMHYCLVRFFLDFLREGSEVVGGDSRYGYLTPAQWFVSVLFLALTTYVVWSKITTTSKIGS